MKKYLLVLMIVTMSLNIVACEIESPADEAIQEELITQTAWFRVWKLSQSGSTNRGWRYEIGNAGNLLASGITDWYEPNISIIEDSVVRLTLNIGTNNKKIIYYDCLKNKASNTYEMMTVFSDLVDEKYSLNGQAIIAYPLYLQETHETIIIIQNIFDDSYYFEMDVGIEPIFGKINTLTLLSTRELYIDFDMEETDGSYTNKKIIVTFDSSGYHVNELNLV